MTFSEADTQVREIVGRNKLVEFLLLAGVEVAIPLRDRGVDLIAYIENASCAAGFAARPIQMKCAAEQSFEISRKYDNCRGLLLAFVWEVTGGEGIEVYLLSYRDAIKVADQMGYTKTTSWIGRGHYAVSRPGKQLRKLLDEHRVSAQSVRSRLLKDDVALASNLCVDSPA